MTNNNNLGIKVSVISIVLNIILSLGKFFAGIIAGSAAMLSDAIHSASDVVSSFVVIIGLKISEKAPDDEHPYGHDRMECLAAIVLAGVLVGTGLGIGYSGVKSIIHGTYSHPENLAIYAAIASIVIKEGMYWYTRIAGKKINSSALMADAWHHRTDALSSVGALIGILGAQHGFPWMDSLASVIIAVFVLIAAYRIFMDASDRMVDGVAENEDEIREYAMSIASVDMLKTRKFGNRVYVDMEISLDGSLSLHEAHAEAERVHDLVEAKFPDIKHILIHVNPDE